MYVCNCSDDAVTVKPDVVETQNSRTEAVELQAKLTQLGHQLIAKQSTISDLQSDRTILKSMLQDAKSRWDHSLTIGFCVSFSFLVCVFAISDLLTLLLYLDV